MKRKEKKISCNTQENDTNGMKSNQTRPKLPMIYTYMNACSIAPHKQHPYNKIINENNVKIFEYWS